MTKYDIHNGKRGYDSAIQSLRQNSLSENNKKLIEEFLTDAENGQHNPNKPASKPVGERKLTPYCYSLIKLTKSLNKEWTIATNEDILGLINDLKNDKITKKVNGKVQPYAEGSKYSMRILLKMFTRWLNKKHKLNLDSSIIYVGTEKSRLIEYLKKEEVDKLVLGTYNPMYKALIMVSFDAGTRIEELLNVKLKDVRYLDTKHKNKIMTIDIQVSKTYRRTIEIPLAQEFVESWLNHSPKQPEDYLFEKVSYGAVRTYLIKLGKKVLPSTRIYPHLFRHSSATYYASRMNRQQLCKRYGWAFSSKMPDVYIERAGLENSQVVEQFETESIVELRKEKQKLTDELKLINSQLSSFHSKYDKLIEMEETVEELKKAYALFDKAYSDKTPEQIYELHKSRGKINGHRFIEYDPPVKIDKL